MIEDIKAKTVCCYCRHPIDTGEPGYGYYKEFEGPTAKTKYYHSECLNVTEGVEIA